MAKNQKKDPWNKKVNDFNTYDNYQGNAEDDFGAYDSSSSTRQGRSTRPNPKGRTTKQVNRNSGVGSTIFLTFLVAIFFAIIGGAIIFTVWNNRNTNMKTVASNFYQTSTSSVASSSAATSASSSTPASSSSAAKTYTIQAGDYPYKIATDNGLTLDELYKLNPKLDPNNAGFYTDGSQIQAGDVLTISK